MSFSIKDEMPQLAQQYAMYLRNVRGLSPKTVDEYCLDLRTFFRFLKINRGLVDAGVPQDEITVRDLDLESLRAVSSYEIFEFMNFIADERNNISGRPRPSNPFSTISPPTKNCWTRTPRKT